MTNKEVIELFTEISRANTEIGRIRVEGGNTLETLVAQLHATVALGFARILLQLEEKS